jgi:hypothetical protein
VLGRALAPRRWRSHGANKSTMVWADSSVRMSGLMRVRSNVSIRKWTAAIAFAQPKPARMAASTLDLHVDVSIVRNVRQTAGEIDQLIASQNPPRMCPTSKGGRRHPLTCNDLTDAAPLMNPEALAQVLLENLPGAALGQLAG